MKTIGFDVDGILRKLHMHIISAYQKHYPKYGRMFDIDLYDDNNWDFRSAMIRNEPKVYRHFEHHVFENPTEAVARTVYGDAPAYENAKENYSKVYNILKRFDFEVTICTHQRHPNRVIETARFLKRHNFQYDNFITTKSGHKEVFGLSYLIDDKTINVARADKEGNGFLMLRPWNKKDVQRVKHFGETIEDYLTFILNNENLI